MPQMIIVKQLNPFVMNDFVFDTLRVPITTGDDEPPTGERPECLALKRIIARFVDETDPNYQPIEFPIGIEVMYAEEKELLMDFHEKQEGKTN
jgi:hypothetical protein